MRVKFIKYENRDAAIVYLGKGEMDNPQTELEISSLKNNYRDVAVFISGSNGIEKVLCHLAGSRCNSGF